MLYKLSSAAGNGFPSFLAPLLLETNHSTLRPISNMLCSCLDDPQRGTAQLGSRRDADAGLRADMVCQRQRTGVCARVHFARLLPQCDPAVAIAQHRRYEASGKILRRALSNADMSFTLRWSSLFNRSAVAGPA